MEFIKKNIAIVAVIGVIVLGLIGFVLWSRSQTAGTSQAPQEQQEVKQMSPEDIGLNLELTQNDQVVVITASKIDGIESFEYELSYDAEVTEEGETVVIPRGAVGELDIEGGEAMAEVDLGTCSANVCKYDKVMSSIKVLIKVNFEDGSLGSVEDEIAMEVEEE